VREYLYTSVGRAAQGSKTSASLNPADAGRSLEDPIQLGEDGRVRGIDGILDQVSEALVRQARRDRALHDRIGAAVGESVSSNVAPWLALGVVALGTIAVIHLKAAKKRR
jgi:hypothetical protein